MRYPLALILAASLLACGGGEPSEHPSAQTPPPGTPPTETPEGQTPAEPEAPEAPDTPGESPATPGEGVTGESNAGTYRLTWKSDPHPVPLNESFTLEVRIADALDASADLESIELAADAAMPDHAHGMIRTPRVTRLGPGHFKVEGMLFHMPGYWELYFDVSRGPLRERAQFPIELE